MNPHKLNKVDISGLNEQEQKAFKLYGKMPAKNLLSKMQKERKYFDSGDYMMSKAGVSPPQPLGTAIPTPEGVPHASPPSAPAAGVLASSPGATSPGFERTPLPPTPTVPVPNPLQTGAGVGISPAATSRPVEVPGGLAHAGAHGRRGSTNEGPRTSPPGTLRDSNHPAQSSSFPIQHAGCSSSPVKTSALANRLDEDLDMEV
ncbi:hypothetical protein Q5752_005465 [Cryptotrichosporon argae]